jgi:TonB-dependent SusC/RagA subfamily outer membrane receptor
MYFKDIIMIKKIFLIGVIIVITLPCFAQNIKGIITNAKQHPLKGIKVWRKNTTESVKTDKMGVFMFTDLTQTDTLIISVSKKEEAAIPVQDLKEIVIKLEKKNYIIYDGINEYKREYKKILRMNTSTNILTHEQIAKLSANSIYDILKGTLPGVQVSDGTNGQQISIRGGNSFNLNTEPLFVVDGTQYENSADVDASISINDIEKIEVMKDGGAYGMKGANGVIIITTMKR